MKWIFFVCAVFLAINISHSQLKVAEIFTDNIVLQRNQPIKVWGTGNPESIIEVQFIDQKKSTLVDSEGKWNVEFTKKAANTSPQKLKVISSERTIILKNILIGDVWLLLGQSNMEWPMSSETHFQKALLEANNNQLRFYNPRYVGKNIYGQKFDESQKQKLKNWNLFYDKSWQVSDTCSIQSMSAVGYYFGKKIIDSQSIPVGLINLSIGGAPIETFIGENILKSHKNFKAKIAGNWLENYAIPVWVRERGKENLGEKPKNLNHAYKPGFAYISGIKPLFKLPIRGILWYQGESNAQEWERVEEYPELQKLMIQDYRKKWENPNLAFYWVQLSSIDTLNYDSQFWPEFRNGQRRLLEEMKNVGMAVSSDLGERDDIHPRNKKDVGHRLARWALAEVYGKDILVSGPLVKKAIYKDGSIVVHFKYTGGGLGVSIDKSLKGFSLDGKSEIPAKIRGDKVIIRTSEKPEFIYYNWQPWARGNLINSEGLPASTFKIEIMKNY